MAAAFPGPIESWHALDGIKLAVKRDEDLLNSTLPTAGMADIVEEAFGQPLPDEDLVVFVMGMYSGVVAERIRTGLVESVEGQS